MAQRRMFSLDIVGSDAFLDMPTSSQALYFHLGMYADDDGFINPKRVMRIAGVQDDDLKVLIGKRFVLPFENGVVVIKHWKMNNYIQKDRYRETVYTEQKGLLNTKDNGSYTECIQNVSNLYPQVRLGKVRLGKEKGNFVPPTLSEIVKYFTKESFTLSPEDFLDKNTAGGWLMNGGKKVKDWKAHARSWERRQKEWKKPSDKYLAFEEMLSEYLKLEDSIEKWQWEGINLRRMKDIINECYPDNMIMATEEDKQNLEKVIKNQEEIKKYLTKKI